MIEPSTRRRSQRVLLVALLVMAILLQTRAALAHVDLVSSTPSDGSTPTGPVVEIELTFSTPATLANDGVVVYDATATPVPATVDVVSDTEVLVTPVTPLEAGAYAVTWAMQAPDAHPTTGGFEFRVEPVAPAVTPTTPQTAPPAADPAESSTGTDSPSILSEVLPAESWLAGWLGALARMLSLGGALLGIGSLVFALLVFEGSRHEARLIGFWIRRSGVAVAVAVPVEILANSVRLAPDGLIGALAPTTLAAATGGAFGLALILRLGGGLAVVAGTRLVTVTLDVPHSQEHRGPLGVLERERLHVVASPAAIVGASLVALSFLFDGHTATAQPAVLVRFASLIHVVGGAIWVAGVALLARLLLGRNAAEEPLDAARLVIPFSTIAGAAVAMIGLAGGVLALFIADGVGTFFATGWGRALLVKMLLAGTAGAIGAYNHRYVVPTLRNDPTSPMAEDAIRRTIGIEMGLLLGVVAVTAVFVGLSAT